MDRIIGRISFNIGNERVCVCARAPVIGNQLKKSQIYSIVAWSEKHYNEGVWKFQYTHQNWSRAQQQLGLWEIIFTLTWFGLSRQLVEIPY